MKEKLTDRQSFELGVMEVWHQLPQILSCAGLGPQETDHVIRRLQDTYKYAEVFSRSVCEKAHPQRRTHHV